MVLFPILRAQGLPGAVDERLLFGAGQSSSRMQRHVVPEGHVASIHLSGDVVGMVLRPVPLAEVQMSTAAIHVVLDEPGHGRHVGIPGPNGFVAVAVEAGAAEQ